MEAVKEIELYSTAIVAQKAGVHRDTLLRWLRKGLIPEPTRNRNGWRVFSTQEMGEIVQYAQTEVEPQNYSTKTIHHHQFLPHEIKKLQEIDWDFVDAKTTYLTHGIHPYPAKYIPQIPNALIQELCSVEETVLDIFCGSGTTLVEALLLKRNAIGIDANPLACLISRAKTTHISEKGAERLQLIAEEALSFANNLSPKNENLLFNEGTFRSNGPRPDWDKLLFWFPEHVIEELSEILSWCQRIDCFSERELALASFSSIIVSVSNQDSDTRYTRREKNTQPGDTFRKFSRALSYAVNACLEFSDLVETRFQSNVIHANLLEKPACNQADLVVCSPPYPNAYSYHLYHMSRMLWLGMNQPKFKQIEIGSHRKYSQKGKNGATADTFMEEMDLIFEWLSTILKKGRYACFVVGDSTIRGEQVDNSQLLCAAAKKHGFLEVTKIPRTLQATKKAFNPKLGKIKEETILILQNGK